MNIVVKCLQCVALVISTASAQYAETSSPVKRTYVLHRGINGEPRYTSLVRRNFLRFGKRGGGDSGPGYLGGPLEFLDTLKDYQESYSPDPDLNDLNQLQEPENNILKRARDFIRFGKRQKMMEDKSEDEGEEADDNQNIAGLGLKQLYPYKRFGRRRMSNFLRFG